MRAARLPTIYEMQDTAAAQSLSKTLTIVGAEFSRVSRIAHQRICALS
jgi:hypothetical protein